MKNIYIVLITFIFFVGCKSSILNTDHSEPHQSISYSISSESYVKLTLENSYHTIVSILVDGKQSAGGYQIIVDTKDLPKGIYFYNLTAKGINDNSYSEETKKIFLN